MSWLGTCLIESFAAYGEAMSPGFFYTAELIDRQEHERNSQPRWQPQANPWGEVSSVNATHPRSLAKSKRSARARTGSVGWSAGITSPVARFWSKMRREREIRLTIRKLQALDNLARTDIDTCQSQIESAMRHRNRNE
jgi:hypothetical protein